MEFMNGSLTWAISSPPAGGDGFKWVRRGSDIYQGYIHTAMHQCLVVLTPNADFDASPRFPRRY